MFHSKPLSLVSILLVLAIASARADDPAASFDSGVLAIRGATGEVRCEQNARGFVTLSAERWRASADPASSDFLRALDGASAHALRSIVSDGRMVLGDMSVSGTLNVTAYQLLLTGKLQARSLKFTCADRLDIEASAKLTARDGDNGGEILCVSPIVITGGTLDASGVRGGNVCLDAKTVLNYGSFLANGSLSAGKIAALFSTQYTENASSRLSVRSEQGSGGEILLCGGKDAGFFSSASMDATGKNGGTIHLLGLSVKLAAATIDASGEWGGGTVLMGGDKQGANPEILNAKTVVVSGATRISADARVNGCGGKIVVWSDNKAEVAGRLSARGGAKGGDGGFIETSGKGDLAFGGKADAAAPYGKAGQWLLDPKNITVGTSNSLVQFQLIDPSPSVVGQDNFGFRLLPLATGNVVVVDPGDAVGGKGAGAIHLYNGKSGALISTVVGAAGNSLGAGGQFADPPGVPTAQFQPCEIINAKGAAYVLSPNVGTGKGALTYINGTTGTAGTIGVSNSLLGVTAGEFPPTSGGTPVIITTLSNGRLVLGCSSFNNNRGFSQLLDQNTGLPVGANAFAQPSATNSLFSTTNSTGVGSIVTDLKNGHYLVFSNSSTATQSAGALTFCSSTTPTVGLVSSANSLVGSSAIDSVGANILILPNGNYLVITPGFAGGIAGTPKGAVTFCDGNTGLTGPLTTANSFIGINGSAASSDAIASGGVFVLTNSSNYVIVSPGFSQGKGAVTWGSGTAGVVGNPTVANSLIGVTGGATPDSIGLGNNSSGVVRLTNGNYVVISPGFSGGFPNGKGAVTFVNGATGLPVGVVSAANSLVGTTAGDSVGGQASTGVAALSNGNYVVGSPAWDNVAITDAGAATLCNGTNGTPFGTITSANSLVGTNNNDRVGSTIVPLVGNGNYVVVNSQWNNNTGSVAWGNGSTGVKGNVSAVNSLLGSTTNDNIGGQGVVTLPNGNYVVVSPNFSTGRGAVTFINGSVGMLGTVAVNNSFVGANANDQVGGGGVTALPNSNFVIRTNGFNGNRGALTLMNGVTGNVGLIGNPNSLTGFFPQDLSSGTLTTLNGNAFVVTYPSFDDPNGPVTDAGAVVFSNGSTLPVGNLNSTKALVGGSGSNGDQLGSDPILKLSNGNYAVCSSHFNNFAGAVTVCDGITGKTGLATAANSVTGASANDNFGINSSPNQNITLLSNGDFVVFAPQAFNGAFMQAGAACLISASTGQSLTGFGPISSNNSLRGGASFTQMSGVNEDAVNGTYLARFPSEGNGKVRVALTGPSGLTYASASSSDVTVSAAFIQSTLTAGTAVTMQANTDITVTNPVTVTGNTPGALTLNAGRSVLLNANITTSNGALTIVANDRAANGVVAAQRTAGAGAVTMAAGTVIDAGTGAVSVSVQDGAGVANASSGPIALTTVKGGNLTLSNIGPTAGSSITASDVQITGDLSVTGTGGPVAVTSSAPVQVASISSKGDLNLVTTAGSQLTINGSASTTGGGNMTLTHAGTMSVTAGGLLNTDGGSITESGGGASLGGDVHTVNGAITWQGPVSIGANIMMDAGTAAVSFTNLNLGTSTFSVVGALAFAGNAQLANTMGGPTAAEQGHIDLTGTLNLGATTYTGTLGGAFTPAAGSPITLITNDGTADPVQGTLNGQPDGSTLVVSGQVLQVKYTGGDGNDVILQVPMGNPPGNNPPVISSNPTATPNPAVIGQQIQFAVTATDQDSDPLIIGWNFGDGTSGSGNTPTHTYMSSGTFNVIVSVSDGKAAPVTANLQVVVNGLVGSGADTDGDGFSDSFETAAGTNPGDAASTPIGGAPATPAAINTTDLTIAKATAKLNFAKQAPTDKHADTLAFSGTIKIPANFNITSQKVVVDIGGTTKSFTLDAKGKGSAKTADGSVKITVKAKKGVVAAQAAKYTISLPKGAFAAALADEGLVGTADIKKPAKPVQVLYTVIFNNTILQHMQALDFTAKKGKTGAAKIPPVKKP